MKYLFILILSLFLFSCTTNSDTLVEKENKPDVIEESTEIINDYVDTLENSIGDAKDVRKMMNSKNNTLENKLNSIY